MLSQYFVKFQKLLVLNTLIFQLLFRFCLMLFFDSSLIFQSNNSLKLWALSIITLVTFEYDIMAITFEALYHHFLSAKFFFSVMDMTNFWTVMPTFH